MSMKKTGQNKNDLSIVEDARKRNNAWENMYKVNNKNYHLDMNFLYEEDGQWELQKRAEYDVLQKPRYSFNMLIKYINNIVGEYAQSIPDPKVSARLDTIADPQKIELIEGMLNKIDEESRGDIVKQTALDCALSGGYGARRIAVEHEDTYSFNHVIRYKPITDPTKCCWDYKAKLSDKSDGDFCMQKVRLTHEEFESQYPKQQMPETFDNASLADSGDLCITDRYIWIADYYVKEYFDIKIYLLSDGSVVDEENLNEYLSRNNFGKRKEQRIKIEDEAKRKDYTIMYYKITGDRILERAKWDGKRLPIIFQPGIIKYVYGREITLSFIRFVKDSQRLYNWARSENALRVTLDRYERMMAPQTTVAGHEDEWKEQYKAKSALIYTYVPGTPIPSSLPKSPRDPGLDIEMNQSLMDIQGVTGRYEANVGMQGNELSGVAINARQGPSNMAVQPYFINARLADESMYFATLDLMPIVYDTTRSIVLKNKDGSENQLVINDENGTKNSVVGKYNVSVRAGSSFEIQQKESVKFLFQWLASSPELASILNPVIAKNLNIRGAELIQQGIKQMISQPQQPNPAIIMQQQQQQLEQMRIMLEKFSHETNRITAESVAFKNQATGESAMMSAETERELAKVKGAETAHSLSLQEEKVRQESLRTEVELLKHINNNKDDQNV
jgi:hypothetical protein